MNGNPHPPTSRYAGLETAAYELRGGITVAYLRRRFVPAPERFAPLHGHVVVRGERPDTIAAAELGDPEQFWRLCDVNRVLDPRELTAEPGRVLIIALPEGIPGALADA